MSVTTVSASLLRRTALLLSVAAFAGCAGLPQPFSQLSGQRYFRAPIDTYPVQIVSVDGRDTLDKLVFIDPGLRKISVQGPPDGVHRFGEQRTIDLNVAPCMRYYLVAVKPTSIAVDFQVKVDYEEPIGGCKAAASS